LISYFFGAYTFHSEPPFNLTAISRFPIVHRAFYDGEWSHYKNYVDYIVFPMSYVILPASKPCEPFNGNIEHEYHHKHCHQHHNNQFDPNTCDAQCQAETTLLISIGVQDKNGWLAKINLAELLDSLVPLRNSDRTIQNIFGQE